MALSIERPQEPQFGKTLRRNLGLAFGFLLLAAVTGEPRQGVGDSGPDLDRVRAFLQKGEVDRAIQVSRQVIANPAIEEDTLLRLGQLLAEHRAFPAARAAFDRILERDLTSFPATYNLGYAYFQEGNLTQARKCLTRSVELDPGSHQANLLLGMTLIRMGERQQGLEQLRKAERLDPQNLELLKFLAMQYSEAGLHKEALSALRRALVAGGAEADVYVLLVECYRRAADFQGALEAAREAVQRFPESPRLTFLLGVRLQAVGRVPESRQYFQRCVSLDPNFVDGYVALGELARRDGKSQEAVPLLQKALALRPDYPDALLELAKDYKDLGDLTSAERVLLLAALKDRENPAPHLLLSQIYAAQKENEKSQKERRTFQDLKRRASSHQSAESTQGSAAPELKDDR